MIAGPSSPGVGAPVNHPAGKAPGGVSSVPSRNRPRAIRGESTPIAGIRSRIGTDRVIGTDRADTRVGAGLSGTELFVTRGRSATRAGSVESRSHPEANAVETEAPAIAMTRTTSHRCRLRVPLRCRDPEPTAVACGPGHGDRWGLGLHRVRLGVA